MALPLHQDGGDPVRKLEALPFKEQDMALYEFIPPFIK